ncbi:basic salivary proline-rich protein 3-like [Sus scrofa]|uniref:basic salivary proline-rich protein 3-like n=1 Tax=Sus scrofa TaxID=9823 RepID=UPI000A2AF314|nr:basic salivary proline-rich protein 3-like [Sus scrofa]
MSLTTLEGLAPPEAQPEAGDLEPEAKTPAERKDPGAAPRGGPEPQEDSAPGQGGNVALSEGHSRPRGDSPPGEDEPSAPLPRGPAPLEESPPGQGGTMAPPAGGPGPQEDSAHGQAQPTAPPDGGPEPQETSPPGQGGDENPAPPTGGRGSQVDSPAGQDENAAPAASPHTDVPFPVLDGNVAPASAGDKGPEEHSAALLGAPALTAPAPPVPGPGLALSGTLGMCVRHVNR